MVCADEQMSVDGTAASKVGDAVGVLTPVPEPRHWYIAIVNNNSEKVVCECMEKHIEWQPAEKKDYEVYVPIQKELREWKNGKRVKVDRILFPAYVFVRCTELVRRRDIVCFPFIKRFLVNAAGTPLNGRRPVAVVPDRQMAALQRMVAASDSPVTVEARSYHLGERVRVNGGKLVGLEGNILREADGSTSFVVKIDILGCAKVTIDSDMLDPIIGQ